MDSFAALKRRTTDLINSIPQSLPSLPALPSLPSIPSLKSQHAYTVKGTWERISVPPLPRAYHSLDVVSGTAYVFGGEARPGKLADNDVHAITLPFSSAPADYFPIKARAEKHELPPIAAPPVEDDEPTPTEETPAELTEISLSPSTSRDDPPLSARRLDKGKQRETEGQGTAAPAGVPSARAGHATATIGHRIFLFGGRDGNNAPLDEGGRVWVFDTRTHLWSFLDPSAGYTSPGPGNAPRPAAPAPRSGHAAVATDKPDFDQHRAAGPKPLRRAGTWKEWAQGDSGEVGIPQRPIVGNVAEKATDADAEGFGTLIVHGGVLAGGARAADVWAFDVRGRVWQELPAAPGAPRSGAGLCISRSRLYRFGGTSAAGGEEGGQVDYLELSVDVFDDQVSSLGEVSLSSRGGWRSLVRGQEAAESVAVGYKEDATAEATAPLAKGGVLPDWPGGRGAAGLEALTVGGGREYLVLLAGQKDAAGSTGISETANFWNDAWAFQVPSLHSTPASLTDTVLSAVGRKSGEGTWAKIEMAPLDDEDDASADGPGARGYAATSTMGQLEENGIVLWGGIDGRNRPLGDGWIIRIG